MTGGEIAWHLVCGVDEVAPEDARRFEMNGRVYAVFHARRAWYATDGLCTHEQAELTDGLVSGDYVICPKHNSRFHIPTGKALRIPARVDLATYPVKTEGGKVYIGLTIS